MFVIIPLGGIGKRFSELGYLDPKPLIRVHGKELILWLIDSLKLKKNDKVFIVYNKILENYNFENKIYFPIIHKILKLENLNFCC